MTIIDTPTTPLAVTLNRVEMRTMHIPIEGVTPLITNRWSEKARRLMLDSQQGKAKPKKSPKDPDADFKASLYTHADGWHGVPATAFKAAIADAARFFDKSITITMLKRSVFVEGEGDEQLVRIDGSEPRMREDMVRNASGVADIRYRGQFDPWRASLFVTFPTSVYTPETIVALVDAAGNNGVGEWRPSAPKNNAGTYGRWRVVEGLTLEAITED